MPISQIMGLLGIIGNILTISFLSASITISALLRAMFLQVESKLSFNECFNTAIGLALAQKCVPSPARHLSLIFVDNSPNLTKWPSGLTKIEKSANLEDYFKFQSNRKQSKLTCGSDNFKISQNLLSISEESEICYSTKNIHTLAEFTR